MTEISHPRTARLPFVVNRIAAGLLMLAGAGCVARNEGAAAPTLERLVAAPASSGWTSLSTAHALLRLPAVAGAATSVSENLSPERTTQEIVLAGPRDAGRNNLTVTVQREPGRDMARPTEAGIKADIAAAFPDQPMRIVEAPRSNAFGPYGLAVGVTPTGLRCTYAWQWLDRDDRTVADRLGGNASWRARLCRRDMTLDQIAAALDSLDIGARGAPPGLLESSTPPTRARPDHARMPRATSVRAMPDGSPIKQPAPDTAIIQPGSGRYLAPVADAPTPAVSSRDRAGLDVSLPAEAYRGPSQRPGPATRASADWRLAVQLPN